MLGSRSQRRFAHTIGWNALASGVVFLPVFLFVVPFEGLLHGISFEGGGILAQLGSAAFVYVAFVVPVVAGSAVHSIALLVIPDSWTNRKRRIFCVGLAILVPITVLLIGGLGGGVFLLTRVLSTTIATIAYGLLAAVPASSTKFETI